MTAQVKSTMVIDDKDAVAALHRIQMEIQKLRDANRKLTQESKRAAKQGKNAFGGMVKQMTSAILGANLLTSAVQKITQAYKSQLAVRREAEANVLERGTGAAKLLQMAAVEKTGVARQAKMESLMQLVRRAERRGMSTATAGDLVFRTESAKETKNLDLYLRLASSGAMQNEDLATLPSGIAAIKAASGGRAGSTKEILNMVFAASAKAPAQVNELLKATAQPAVMASLLKDVKKNNKGIKISELLPALALAAKSQGSVEEASTALRALSRAFISQPNSDEYVGLGLFESVEKMQKERPRQLNQFRKMLGRQKGLLAYQTIVEHLPELKQDAANVAAARGRRDITLDVERLAAIADPAVAIARQKRLSGGMLNIGKEKIGTAEAKYQLSLAEQEYVYRKGGASETFIWGAKQISKLGRMIPFVSMKMKERGVGARTLDAIELAGAWGLDENKMRSAMKEYEGSLNENKDSLSSLLFPTMKEQISLLQKIEQNQRSGANLNQHTE